MIKESKNNTGINKRSLEMGGMNNSRFHDFRPTIDKLSKEGKKKKNPIFDLSPNSQNEIPKTKRDTQL